MSFGSLGSDKKGILTRMFTRSDKRGKRDPDDFQNSHYSGRTKETASSYYSSGAQEAAQTFENLFPREDEEVSDWESDWDTDDSSTQVVGINPKRHADPPTKADAWESERDQEIWENAAPPGRSL
jgi:hypothetical protein